MPLSPGDKLGPYEILSAIGAGGMGAVWKARDTRLDRTVAIKTVEGRFSERFEREAKTIASLNHPHICTLHDVGENYLVMEFIDGEPVKGPLAVAEVVRLGAQIAGALDAAHRKGITHRDLKPGNVTVTKAGSVKVIDFGLAKGGSPVRVGEADLTLTKPLTAEGTILGTVPYMSPEQLQGLEADARSVVFALGCVLYEMLTGKRAFEGKSQVSIMAAILEHEPAPLAAPVVPAWLDRLIRRCLRKNPDQRWQSAGDIAIELREPHDDEPRKPAPDSPSGSVWWPVSSAAVAVAACTALFAMIIPRGDISGQGLRLTPIALGDGSHNSPAFSPDGKSIAYFRTREGRRQILVKVLGADASTVLVDAVTTGFGRSLLWSPDGERILYSDGSGLWRIGVAGGTPEKVLDRLPGVAAWLPGGDGLLILQRSPTATAKFSVSQPLGSNIRPLDAIEPLPGLADGMRFSPDGRKLAVATGDGVWIWQWPKGARRFVPVRTGRAPHWFPDSRHFLVASFSHRQVLAFDSESDAANVIRSSEERIREATLSGDGRRIVYNTGPSPTNTYQYRVSSAQGPSLLIRDEANSGNWTPDGRTFVFRRFSERGLTDLLAKDDQTGQIRPLVKAIPSENVPLTPSPDGKRVAYVSAGKLWAVATTGGPPLAIADCEGVAIAWSPDGAWLVFRRTPTLVKVSSQGGSPAIVISRTEGGSAGLAWTNAGIYYRRGQKLVRVPPEGGGPVELADMAGSLEHASPDGRFLYSRRTAPERPALVVHDAATGLEVRSIPIPTDGDLRRLSVHPSGQRIAAEVSDSHFDLWMMEGFPAPAVGWERLFWRWLERPEAQ